ARRDRRHLHGDEGRRLPPRPADDAWRGARSPRHGDRERVPSQPADHPGAAPRPARDACRRRDPRPRHAALRPFPASARRREGAGDHPDQGGALEMARAFKPRIATGNALLEGDVVYFTAEGGWSRDIGEAAVAADPETAAALFERAREFPNEVVGVYLAEVRISE